jgi:hypothetical protein
MLFNLNFNLNKFYNILILNHTTLVFSNDNKYNK